MRKPNLVIVLLTATIVATVASAKPPPVVYPPLPTPTFANVKYGPHDRNILDFWQAKSDKPTPVLFFVHGGGWRGGAKEALAPQMLSFMLDHGISVVSINYRYSQQAILPAPVHDAARALQFVRSKTHEWNLNKKRIAAEGGSAGACTTLWLAYHDDLADRHSSDPVARESTRLCAAVGVEGQTSIDPKIVVPWVGEAIMNHGMMFACVGATNKSEAMAAYDEYAPLYHEYSPINHVTRDDPPVLLYYLTPTPLPATDAGIAIHHAMLGQKLKEKSDKVGAKCEFVCEDKVEEYDPIVLNFLLENLKKP